MEPSYLSTLNDAQKKAVLHGDGPALVIAGAGSGKTKTLTSRIAYLIDQGVHARDILALTFTNKAANEMLSRVESLLHRPVKRLYIGTFHSCFLHFLREDAHILNYPPHFSVYDTDDSKNLIAAIKTQLQIGDEDRNGQKTMTPQNLLARISRQKNNMVSAEHFWVSTLNKHNEDTKNFARIYLEYTKRCFAYAAMDFDDLLLKMYELLRDVPAMREKYQHKFSHILVDEYQDTNALQAEIVRYLAQKHQNIFVVGDDSQSIYGFRGADITNIVHFSRNYPDAKIITLEQNYRSTKTIVEAANAIITHNKVRLPKKIWTANTVGTPIRIRGFEHASDEAREVVATIQEEKLRNHHNNRDFAILYRNNAHSRALEEELRRASIPYRIYGGLSFYQRKEIKDIIAYLRVVVNRRDDESLKRIINYPARGIGGTSLLRYITHATNQSCSLWEALCDPLVTDIPKRIANQVAHFVHMIDTLAQSLQTHSASEIVEQLYADINLYEVLKEETKSNALSYEVDKRIYNIESFLEGVKDFEQRQIEEHRSFHLEDEENEQLRSATNLATYLQSLSLYTQPDEPVDSDNHVSLLTVHGAKGLEFPCVFVVRMVEHVFPALLHMDAKDDLDQRIEEERRLFYVAVSRAEKKLWLSYNTVKSTFRSPFPYSSSGDKLSPSRFLSEIPEQYIHHTDHQRFVSQTAESNRYTHRPVLSISTTRSTRSQRLSSTPPKPTAPTNAFQPTADKRAFIVGKTIRHTIFGRGKIINVETKNNVPEIILVHMYDGTRRSFLLAYAKIQVLD